MPVKYFQEVIPRHKAVQFNGIEDLQDVLALLPFFGTQDFQLATRASKLTLEVGGLILTPGDYLVSSPHPEGGDRRRVLQVMSADTFLASFEELK